MGYWVCGVIMPRIWFGSSSPRELRHRPAPPRVHKEPVARPRNCRRVHMLISFLAAVLLRDGAIVLAQQVFVAGHETLFGKGLHLLAFVQMQMPPESIGNVAD